jgi:hypothetical protein
VTFSCVLLVWSGVALERLAAGQTADLGFPVDRLAFVETDAGFAGYGAPEAAALYETWRDRIAALPGVEAATRAAGPPSQWQTAAELDIDGYESVDGEVPLVVSIWAGPRYFETLQIPLLYGRAFTEFDRPGAPGVAVISEHMARRYFGTLNAVGRRFGVVRGSGPPSGGAVDSSFEVVRTSLDPASLLQPMQQVLRDLGGGLPVIRARKMSQQVAESTPGVSGRSSLVRSISALASARRAFCRSRSSVRSDSVCSQDPFVDQCPVVLGVQRERMVHLGQRQLDVGSLLALAESEVVGRLLPVESGNGVEVLRIVRLEGCASAQGVDRVLELLELVVKPRQLAVEVRASVAQFTDLGQHVHRVVIEPRVLV